MALFYVGTIHTKDGREIARQLAETREEAARALFASHPNAKRVSTCEGFEDPYTGEMRSAGRNIQWIENRQMPQKEAIDAIRARIEGVWDHPALVALGPLTRTEDDILRIIQRSEQ